MFLSKMTAATLEDINYIVDTSMVKLTPEYTLVHWCIRRLPTMLATQLPPATIRSDSDAFNGRPESRLQTNRDDHQEYI